MIFLENFNTLSANQGRSGVAGILGHFPQPHPHICQLTST